MRYGGSSLDVYRREIFFVWEGEEAIVEEEISVKECPVKFYGGRSHLRDLAGWLCRVWACGEEGMNILEKRSLGLETPLLVFYPSPTSFLNYPVPHSSLYSHILPLSSLFLRPDWKCCAWAPNPLFVSLWYHVGAYPYALTSEWLSEWPFPGKLP